MPPRRPGNYSVEDEAKREEYFIRARLVDRVVIRNLKVVKSLELTMPTPPIPTGPRG